MPSEGGHVEVEPVQGDEQVGRDLGEARGLHCLVNFRCAGGAVILLVSFENQWGQRALKEC